MVTTISRIWVWSHSSTRQNKCRTWTLIENRHKWITDRNWRWSTRCSFILNRIYIFWIIRNCSIPGGRESLDIKSEKKKNILAMKAAPYTIVNKFLYKLGLDNILWRCVLDHRKKIIINEAHYSPPGGHFQANMTARKSNSCDYGCQPYTGIVENLWTSVTVANG